MVVHFSRKQKPKQGKTSNIRIALCNLNSPLKRNLQVLSRSGIWWVALSLQNINILKAFLFFTASNLIQLSFLWSRVQTFTGQNLDQNRLCNSPSVALQKNFQVLSCSWNPVHGLKPPKHKRRVERYLLTASCKTLYDCYSCWSQSARVHKFAGQNFKYQNPLQFATRYSRESYRCRVVVGIRCIALL